MAKSEELENLTKKERKEYIKNLHSTQSDKDKRVRLIVTISIVVGVILAGVGIYFLSASKSTSNIADVGEKVKAMDPPNDRLHVEVGATHVPYSTNPPTSGPHYNTLGYGPVPCQVYTKEIYDESVLHDLEHGAVWVTYKDINDKALAAKLKSLVENYSKVLLSPRSKNDSKIALVSWLHILKLDSFDETKVRNFIRLYRDSKDAPEQFGTCGTSITY